MPLFDQNVSYLGRRNGAASQGAQTDQDETSIPPSGTDFVAS